LVWKERKEKNDAVVVLCHLSPVTCHVEIDKEVILILELCYLPIIESSHRSCINLHE
jgi:hypothetical protein